MAEKTTHISPMTMAIAVGGMLTIGPVGAGAGVAIYAPAANTAAGLHIMSPKSPGPLPSNPSRYADTAIPLALDRIREKGIEPPFLVVVTGGCGLAQMPEGFDPGKRNLEAVHAAVKGQGLSVNMEKSGGSKLWTLALNVDAGQVKITAA